MVREENEFEVVVNAVDVLEAEVESSHGLKYSRVMTKKKGGHR
jgi:hypothetical protein